MREIHKLIALNKPYVFAVLSLSLLLFGCLNNLPDRENKQPYVNELKRDCALGFGYKCYFKCANNVFASESGADAAGVYIAEVYLNGSNGNILARCGGNIKPVNSEDCKRISETCDYSNPVDNVNVSIARRIFRCENNVFVSRNRGGDVAVYVNGSDNEVLTRCIESSSVSTTCGLLPDTCDFSKPADTVPDAVLKLFIANPPIGFGDYDDVPRPVKGVVDNNNNNNNNTVDTVFSVNLSGYFVTCTSNNIISKRVNGSWEIVSDHFPEKGFYLDDTFIFIDTSGFGCDALSCLELPTPYTIPLVEHTKIGEKAPPPHSDSAALTVPVYQTVPLKGEIKIDIEYFSDKNCGDKKNFSKVITR